jgi:hypothetical protein
MTGTLCVLLLTKSSDLPLYYYYFFFNMYDYSVIDNGYRKASSYIGGFDPEDA